MGRQLVLNHTNGSLITTGDRMPAHEGQGPLCPRTQDSGRVWGALSKWSRREGVVVGGQRSLRSRSSTCKGPVPGEGCGRSSGPRV